MMKYYKIYGDRCLEFGEKVVFWIWDKLGSKMVYVIARKVMGSFQGSRYGPQGHSALGLKMERMIGGDCVRW